MKLTVLRKYQEIYKISGAHVDKTALQSRT